jgi:hypothetical protein
MSSSPASRSRPALPLFDTPERYGWVSIALHWLAALGMIGLLLTGYAFMVLPRGSIKGAVLMLHDAGGYLTLILALAHVAWRPFNRFPELSAGAAWENTLARLAHWLLLGFLVVLPLSGWFAHSTGRNPPPRPRTTAPRKRSMRSCRMSSSWSSPPMCSAASSASSSTATARSRG